MLKKSKIIVLPIALLSIHITTSYAFADDVTKSVEDALKFGNGGAVKFDLNYRYENVNQDNVTNPQLNGKPLPAAIQPITANANTVRLRLGLLSPVFHGLQGYAEYQGVYAMQSDYNSTRNDKTQYSTIPDPYENELDQLWLSYAGIPDTVIKGFSDFLQRPTSEFSVSHPVKLMNYYLMLRSPVEAVMNKLNHRLRKTLKFKTPHTVFFADTLQEAA